jgi:DNA uptake protein ComE-like DNA-binding protein
MMTVMLDLTGQPVQVPEIQVDLFRRKGWRSMPTATTETPSETTQADLVSINDATLAELTALPQIGVKMARRVIAARPITDLAELTAKVDGVDWLALEAQIGFN